MDYCVVVQAHGNWITCEEKLIASRQTQGPIGAPSQENWEQRSALKTPT
jgi:hypothetical protein